MSKKQNNFDDSILSFNYEDDDENYNEFSKYLDNNTERLKNKQANEISQFSEILLSEIDHKNQVNDKKKDVMIKYITSKTDKYSAQYLKDLDIYDVIDIHDEIKENNKSFIKNFFQWLFS